MRNVRNSRTALATLLVAACAALAGFGGTALAAQDGINIDNEFVTAAQTAHVEALVDRLRPGWVRVWFNWDAIEPTPGGYSTYLLGEFRQFFASFPAGTKVDAVLVRTPSWAGPAVYGPPTSDQSFAGFANYVANYFGSQVSAYEIWNEEDSPTTWSGTPAQYVGLLSAAYPAIKAADPGATVMLGGLGANDYPYLQQLYQAGAEKYFDAVGVHTDDACSITSPYAFAYNPGTLQINRWSFLGFTTVHSVMAANGDASKPIFMTELGWATTQTTCDSGSSAGKRVAGVSDKKQALYLRQAYHCLAQPQYSYVTAGMWFDIADFAPQDTFRNRYGLMTYGLTPKPSFKAFANLSAHGDTLKGACGNFAGPSLRMYSPYNGEHYNGPLRITVSAKRNGKAPGDIVGQIELFHDGQRIMYFNRVDASYHDGVLSGTLEWQGAKYLSPGPHVITAKVNNANGVTTTVKVTVFHS